MDVNYYLHREQIERMRADAARNDAARDVHGRLADLYRDRLQDYRTERTARTAPPAARPPLARA